MFKRKIDVMKIDDMFGLGFDFARLYLNEYSWWECEMHLTIGNRYVTIYLNAKGLPDV